MPVVRKLSEPKVVETSPVAAKIEPPAATTQSVVAAPATPKVEPVIAETAKTPEPPAKASESATPRPSVIKSSSSKSNESPAESSASTVSKDVTNAEAARAVRRIDEALLATVSAPSGAPPAVVKTSKDDEEIILRTRSAITSPSPAPPVVADLSRTAPAGSVSRQLSSTNGGDDFDSTAEPVLKSKTIHMTPSKSSAELPQQQQRPSTTGSTSGDFTTTASTTGGVSASPGAGSRIDWTRVPLPASWERRKDLQSGKVIHM